MENIKTVLTAIVDNYENDSGTLKDGTVVLSFKEEGIKNILFCISFDELNRLVHCWDTSKIAEIVQLKDLIMLFNLPEEFAVAEVESLGGEKKEFTKDFLNFTDAQTQDWLIADLCLLMTSLLFTAENRLANKIKKSERDNFAARLAYRSAKIIFSERHASIVDKLRPLFIEDFLKADDSFLRQLKNLDIAWIKDSQLGDKIIESDDRSSERQKKQNDLPLIFSQSLNRELADDALKITLLVTKKQKDASVLAHNMEITSASPESIRTQYLTSQKIPRVSRSFPIYGKAGTLLEALHHRMEWIAKQLVADSIKKPHWKPRKNKKKK